MAEAGVVDEAVCRVVLYTVEAVVPHKVLLEVLGDNTQQAVAVQRVLMVLPQVTELLAQHGLTDAEMEGVALVAHLLAATLEPLAEQAAHQVAAQAVAEAHIVVEAGQGA
jgi:hypothetical protein